MVYYAGLELGMRRHASLHNSLLEINLSRYRAGSNSSGRKATGLDGFGRRMLKRRHGLVDQTTNLVRICENGERWEVVLEQMCRLDVCLICVGRKVEIVSVPGF
jgi:hypothetical protein